MCIRDRTKGQIEEYERRGYKVVYEYIDDLNPHLAGTDELPVNVREKYEKTMKEKDSIVVVTADALQRDVLSKSCLLYTSIQRKVQKIAE